MPAGGHGGGHSSGGHGSFGSHSSFSSSSSSHTRVYRPIIFYRHGIPYSVSSSRIARVMGILPFILFLGIFILLLSLLIIPSAKENIITCENDYKYYQEMISFAKDNTSYQTYGKWAGYFNGEDEYGDEDYEDYYGYKFYILTTENTGASNYCADIDSVSYYYVTNVEYLNYAYNGKYYGFTYLLYDSDEIKELRNTYQNVNNYIKLALSTTNDNIKTDELEYTDAIPMDYENTKLDDDYGYLESKEELTGAIISLCVVSGITFILLISLIKNLIPKKGDIKDENKKDNINSQFKNPNGYDRNSIFDDPNDKITKMCQFCGKEVNSDMDRCPYCGSKFL